MDALSHRKASARLRLVRAGGTPAAHTPVDVRQTSHRFLFGCGAFGALDLARESDTAKRPALEATLQRWLALFNYGTLPFYWGRYEPAEGQTGREDMRRAAKMLTARGVTLKGHPLCWHTVCADWLLQYDNAEILRRQLARARRETADFAGLIDRWDAVNEAVIMPDFDRYDNAVTRICREKGRIVLVREVFAAAKEGNPGATLLINDFETGPAYEILIEGLLEAGVPIGAIGIQSHQHQGYWGADKLHAVLDRYARFGLPLHFTENTLISGELMPGHIVDLNDYQVDSWPSTPQGEERQAREIEEMYGILFAHPLVEAITAWDFVDGGWLHAPAGLLREDGTPKPAYDALHALIHGAWETRERLVTDEDGCLAFTGFRGGYALRAGEAVAAFDLDGDVCLTLTLA